MRAHVLDFEPYCANAMQSFESFLKADVETMGVEADEMQAPFPSLPPEIPSHPYPLCIITNCRTTAPNVTG